MATTKPKQKKADLTLAGFAEQYLAHLEKIGKSRGTVFSYSIDLALAVRELGESTLLTDLKTEQVAAFFESEAVTRTKTGKEKASPTILKTRRVLRLGLVWAAEEGLISAAPLPPKAEKVSKAKKPSQKAKATSTAAKSNGSAR